jgi:hypothetical protein
MAIITVKNRAITLDAAEIPNLDASKITSGSFADARIPNLATSKITSGTFADARIAASNVSQHATSFDDNKIVNDLSTLGLRVHTQENLNASNTNSASFDVFQDSSGITNLTNTARNANEYISSVTTGGALPTGTQFYLRGDQVNGSTTFTDQSSNSITVNTSGGIAHSNNRGKIGSTSIYFDGSDDVLFGGNTSAFHFGTGEFKIDMWVNFPNFSSNNKVLFSQGGWGTATDYAGTTFYINTQGRLKLLSSSNNSGNFGSWVVSIETNNLTWNNNTWYHCAVARNSNGELKIFRDGTIQNLAISTGSTGGTDFGEGTRDWKIGFPSDSTTAAAEEMYLDDILITKGSGSGRSGNFTPNTTHYGDTTSATGSFEGNAITASSTSSMGAVITYQDNAGTNTLNTDIILKLSADNGSNYSTATLTALPDFATGIKMAKVNDLSVTAGTSLKYKIEFANQASGSKEARIRGVSLQY